MSRKTLPLTGQFKEDRPRRLSQEELDDLEKLGSAKVIMLAQWANRQLTCSHCHKCTTECEVLAQPGLDMGTVEAAYERIMALPASERRDAVRTLVSDDPSLYTALRRCCFCGHCTAQCQHHVLAPEAMRAWRQLFFDAGYQPVEKLTLVDNEWNIFTAYRAIYGIGYPEFVSLDYAAQHPGMVDTLFFPGCSLLSYMPELVRAVGAWLTDQGFSWALSDDCCASPLMSAGRFDRAAALRESIRQRALAAGITRIITVCPGCGEELAPTLAKDIDIVPLPEVLLAGGRLAVQQGRDPGFHPLERASLTFFDSCHDRHDQRHGTAIRALMREFAPTAQQREMLHHGANTLCCGAGGAVSPFDPELSKRRVTAVIDEARQTQAETLITMCPTCAYTISYACLNATDEHVVQNRHYLEVLFGIEVDWPQIFDNLASMWEGEYGPWLLQTFYS